MNFVSASQVRRSDLLVIYEDAVLALKILDRDDRALDLDTGVCPRDGAAGENDIAGRGAPDQRFALRQRLFLGEAGSIRPLQTKPCTRFRGHNSPALQLLSGAPAYLKTLLGLRPAARPTPVKPGEIQRRRAFILLALND